jgi:HPt (histidine-containing phosphotransfer) domain-containing protein
MRTKHIDLGYLDTMAGDDSEATNELIDIFLEESPQILQGLKEALILKDYVKLKYVAHKSKSSLLIFGMNKLASQMNNLEILLKENKNSDVFIEIISNFEIEFNEAICELKSYLEYKKPRLYK